MAHKVDIVVDNRYMRLLEFGTDKLSHKGFLSILDPAVNVEAQPFRNFEPTISIQI